jgi:FixJ family two-component response regulator
VQRRLGCRRLQVGRGLPRSPGTVSTELPGVDVGLPDLNGLDLQIRIARERTEMPIIFITGYGDVPMTVKAMKAGAAQFLTKSFDDVAMLEAVSSALSHSRNAIGEQAAARALRQRYEILSRRERHVMASVVTCLMNKQVAWRLGISEITVKAHRGRVMEKMQAGSLAELVTICASLGDAVETSAQDPMIREAI